MSFDSQMICNSNLGKQEVLFFFLIKRTERKKRMRRLTSDKHSYYFIKVLLRCPGSLGKWGSPRKPLLEIWEYIKHIILLLILSSSYTQLFSLSPNLEMLRGQGISTTLRRYRLWLKKKERKRATSNVILSSYHALAAGLGIWLTSISLT